MKKKKLEKRAYISPMCKVFVVEPYGQLMETSYPGQHNPGQHGSGPSGAKQDDFSFDDEEENNNEQNYLWEE